MHGGSAQKRLFLLNISLGFGSLSSGIKDVIGALDAAKNIGGGFLKDLEEIGTIVKNVTYQFDKAKDALETDVTSIKNQFDKIKGLVDKTGQENDAKMLVDGQKFNQVEAVCSMRVTAPLPSISFRW